MPRLSGVGGMVSFQGRLAQGLARRGIQVTYDLQDTPFQSVLVVGGTRQLAGLWRLRRRGVRIVQRLDGMNWLHRLQRTGRRHFLRAESGNLLLAFIRRRLAHAIVYQSRFSRQWWERRRGAACQRPAAWSTTASTWTSSLRTAPATRRPRATACCWWKAA